MRRDALPDAPFLERLAHQAEFQLAQVSKTAMDQLGIVRAGRACEVVLFDQRNLQPAHAGVARHARTRHAATDDEQVKFFVGKTVEGAAHGIQRKESRKLRRAPHLVKEAQAAKLRKIQGEPNMAKIRANGIELEYDETGPANGVPFLMINGFGSQMTSWSDEFRQGLVAAGLRFIRFDNRDVGLSQKWHGIVPDI